MQSDYMATSEIIDFVNYISSINLGYLGLAITILVFLGGAFYLFNFKPLQDRLEKQEKIFDDLKKQLVDDVKTSQTNIKGELEDFKSTQTETVFNLVNQENNKLLSDIENKILTFEKEFTENFNSFTDQKDADQKAVILSEINNKIRELEKNLTAMVSVLKTENGKEVDDVKKSIFSLNTSFKELKRTNRILEVFMYSQKGQMGAIYGSIDLLKDAIDEDSWRIDGSLEDLNKEMSGVKLDGELITRIEEQLVRLKDKLKYLPLVDKIRKHYQ